MKSERKAGSIAGDGDRGVARARDSSTPTSAMPLARAVRTAIASARIEARVIRDQRDVDKGQRAGRQDDALEERPKPAEML